MILKVNKKEVLYLSALAILGFSTIVINGSYVSSLLPKITNTVLKYLSLFLFFLSLLEKSWNAKKIILWALIGILTLIVSYTTDKPLIVLTVIAIVGASNIKFEKIKKVVFFYIIIYSFLVVALCLLGFIPDLVIEHNSEYGHSLGFLYYSNLSSNIFMLTLLFFSSKKKNTYRWKKIAIWLLLNFLCYKITTTRLTFFMAVFFLGMIIVFKKISIIQIKNNKFWISISTVLFPALSIFSVWISLMYSNGISWISFLNSMLSSRLRWNYEGIIRYGVSLFGQQLIMIGGTEIATGTHISNYFYIDSGYIYNLLEYGIIFYVLLMIAYTILYRYSVRTENDTLFIWCTLICFHSLINNIILNVAINPILLLLPLALQRINDSKSVSQSNKLRAKSE